MVFAIAVVLVGMLFSLGRINEIEQGLQITGMLSTNETGKGSLSASVATSTTISLPTATINFGSLQPGEWNSSENSSITVGGAGYNTTNVTSNLTVQNDGSVNVDIEVYADDQATAGNGNFSGTSGCITNNNCMMVRCGHVINRNTTGGDCTDAASDPTAYTALPTAAGTTFVSNLNFSDTDDEAYIFVNVTVPEDEHAVSFSQTITFAASAS